MACHHSQMIYHCLPYSLYMIFQLRRVFLWWMVTCFRYHVSLQFDLGAKESATYCYGAAMSPCLHYKTFYLIGSCSLCTFRVSNAASPGNWQCHIISLSVGDKKAFFFLFKEKLMITAVLMFTQTSESTRVMWVYMFTSNTCLALDLSPEWVDGWRWSGGIPHERRLPFGYGKRKRSCQ